MNTKIKNKADQMMGQSKDKSHSLLWRVLYLIAGLITGGASVYLEEYFQVAAKIINLFQP